MHVYEVFIKRDGREEFRHVGALEAADDQLATVLAREVYLRRAEGDRLWVVLPRPCDRRGRRLRGPQRGQAAPSPRRRGRGRTATGLEAGAALSPAGVRDFLLAFADDEHLMGQQHTEWIGVAPFLEEDLAFSSIGQDELGHAALLYELVLELDGIEITDEAVDELAYRRNADDYRSCHLVEASVSDWAEALVRHWVYDTFEAMRWQLVVDSSIPRLRTIAQRALREEAFHRMHADALLDRLLPVSEARGRLLVALEGVMPLVPGLCEPPAGEAAAIAEGVAAGFYGRFR